MEESQTYEADATGIDPETVETVDQPFRSGVHVGSVGYELWESSLPPEFPIIVENGEMEFDLTATQEQFDAFGSALDERGRQYELLTLVHTDERDALLTDRQRECLAEAYRRGYFDVPREWTLADLADALGVDKSTASVTIRRGTGRVVNQFLVGRD